MDFVTFVQGTPLYVWGILAYVIAVGIYFLKDRKSSLAKIALMPCLFIVWSLVSLKGHYGLTTYSVGAWLVGALIGCSFGWLFSNSNPPRLIDRSKAIFVIPGGAAFMALTLSFFLLKYIRGAAFHMHPEFLQNPKTIVMDLIFTGFLVGFLFGRVLVCMNVYRKSAKS